MGRSGVLTGRIDARDRAKLRARRDRKPAVTPDPYDALDAWLKASDYRSTSDAKMPRIDLADFLRRTGHIEIAPEERLRQLAIFVEYDFGAIAPDALDRIYEAAVQLNSQDFMVWHSRGISAKLIATTASRDSVRARYQSLALRWLLRAHELAPKDATVDYMIGKWHYDFGTLDDASSWFDRAVAHEPNHGWARLYRAHCLHDRKLWQDAVRAYLDVPLDAFSGPAGAWRVDVVLEALAHCRLQAGDQSGARADFTRLIERLSKEPARAEMLDLRYLGRACSGLLEPELGTAYQELMILLERTDSP